MMNLAYWGVDEGATEMNALKEFELKSKLQSVYLGVSTNDHEIKMILRALIEPITIFGEGKYERRERLKKILLFKYDRLFHGKDLESAAAASREAKNLYDVIKTFNISMSSAALKKNKFGEPMQTDQAQEQADKELFYTEGEESLKHFRNDLAQRAWTRTRLRKETIHRYRQQTDQYEHRDDIERFGTFMTDSLALSYSHLAADRPLTAAKFSPNMRHFAVASFCSHVDVYQYKADANFPIAKRLDNDSKEMVHCLDWNCTDNRIYDRNSTPEKIHDTELLIATGGSGGTLALWRPFSDDVAMQDHENLCVHAVRLHDARVNRVKFHQFKQLVLTSSADETIRLFDLDRMEELYVQEGHSHAVHGLALNGDGNLMASGDMHGVMLVMDLRTGKHIFQQPMHNGKITAIDFHPLNTHILATAADDNAVKVFDLRKVRVVNSLLAHTKLVSDVQFEPTYGRYLATSSFDTHLKVWDTAEYKCRKVLSNNDARVMALHVAPDSSAIITACYDRTVRVFKPNVQQHVELDLGICRAIDS